MRASPSRHWIDPRPEPGHDRLTVSVLSLICALTFLPGLMTVPPLDRDESRFAQASKQMIETGDAVRIRFQDTARNKKPAGAYWAQAASVQAVSGGATAQIWAYRLPSVLAAWLGVLMIYAVGRLWLGPRLGALAAGLMAVSPMLVLEAHQAKADALLFACIAAAQAALGLLYVHGRDGRQSLLDDRRVPLLAYAFWIAQGLAVLVKGPIGPMISALTVLALAAADRDRRWLASLRAGIGLPLALIVAAPWFIAIALATDGAFFADALGKDLFAKVAAGQESHGAPPGAYAALVHLTLWPAACLLIPALIHAWRNRSEAWVRFALAWAVPAWLVFEAVPTKLPHYVLPLYPALVLIVVRFAGDVARGDAALTGVWRVYAVVVAALTPLVLGAAALYAPVHFDAPTVGAGVWVAAAVVVVCAVAALVLSARAFARADAVRGLRLSGAVGAVMLAAVLAGVMPRLDGMWLSRGVVAAIEADAAGPAPVAAVGYHEPSLVFLAGTRTRLLNGGAAAAAWLRATPDGYAVVTEAETAAFRGALADTAVEIVAEVSGVNYSRGDAMRLSVYRRAR
jgi:4-amino-4-deoxy-L-arabinose transferase-like glycosyltransferase